MLSAIFGNLFSAITNPSVLLLLIGVFGATQIWSRVSGFFETKAVAQTFEQSIAERDRAASIKDSIQQAAIKQREIDNATIQQLREDLLNAQAQLSLTTDTPCRWTVPELGVLNNPGSARKR
jgi:hypothetical protein